MRSEAFFTVVLSAVTLSVIFLHVIILSVMFLYVVMLSVILYVNMLSISFLNVVMLSVSFLDVVTLRTVALFKTLIQCQKTSLYSFINIFRVVFIKVVKNVIDVVK